VAHLSLNHLLEILEFVRIGGKVDRESRLVVSSAEPHWLNQWLAQVSAIKELVLVLLNCCIAKKTFSVLTSKRSKQEKKNQIRRIWKHIMSWVMYITQYL
jgi:hypothetical protein